MRGPVHRRSMTTMRRKRKVTLRLVIVALSWSGRSLPTQDPRSRPTPVGRDHGMVVDLNVDHPDREAQGEEGGAQCLSSLGQVKR